MLRRQRELTARFQSHGATSPERAIPRGELGTGSESVFLKLAAAGVFVQSGKDRWYLDEAAWQRFQPDQRRRSLKAAVVIIALTIGLFLLWLAL